jgi:hypothetical protein
MNSEIAVITMIAPIPIASALEPLSPLSPDVDVFGVTLIGGAPVLVGTGTDWVGTPGEKGLPGAAAEATPGAASATASTSRGTTLLAT